MKQVLQNLRSGETAVEDVPAAAVGRNQLLIQTRASLISAGTERMPVEFDKASLPASLGLFCVVICSEPASSVRQRYRHRDGPGSGKIYRRQQRATLILPAENRSCPGCDETTESMSNGGVHCSDRRNRFPSHQAGLRLAGSRRVLPSAASCGSSTGSR